MPPPSSSSRASRDDRFLIVTTDEVNDELRERGNDLEAYLDRIVTGLHVIARSGSSASGAKARRWRAASSTPAIRSPIWARRLETVEPFADTAATVGARRRRSSPRTATSVCLCVVNDADVERRHPTATTECSPASRPEASSPFTPPCIPTLAAASPRHAVDRGVEVIDAPVSGGGIAAAERKLLVMVGGDDAVVERVRPVFATYADPVLHLGPLGSGQMAKLLNNFVFTAQLTVAAETYDFAARLGMDRPRWRRSSPTAAVAAVPWASSPDPRSTSRVCARSRRRCSPRTLASCSTSPSAWCDRTTPRCRPCHATLELLTDDE